MTERNIYSIITFDKIRLSDSSTNPTQTKGILQNPKKPFSLYGQTKVLQIPFSICAFNFMLPDQRGQNQLPITISSHVCDTAACSAKSVEIPCS